MDTKSKKRNEFPARAAVLLKDRPNTETVWPLPWHRWRKVEAGQGLSAAERRTGTEASKLSNKLAGFSTSSDVNDRLHPQRKATEEESID